MNDDENTMYQNLWDTEKAVSRGKLIAINAYIYKLERSQIKNLTLQHKELEKEDKTNPKLLDRTRVSRSE